MSNAEKTNNRSKSKINKLIAYSLNSDSFQTKRTHKKISKLLRTKKNKEIPSKPKEKYRFKKLNPNL